MGLLTAILAILGGTLASSNVIIDRQPNSKELIDKVVPYQGGIGVALLIIGILTLLRFGSLLSIILAAAEIIVGFLLGYGLLTQYIFNSNESAAEKGAKVRETLAQYQVPAGIGLLILGVISLLRIIF